MANQLQVMNLADMAAQQVAMSGCRPIVNKRLEKQYGAKAPVQIVTNRGIKVNSVLRKDEWEELDRAVVPAAVQPLRFTRLIQARMNLVRPIASLGTLLTQYNQVSEMTPANISLRGHASGEKDLVDYSLVGVPVPIIFKEFEIDQRALLASRMMGDGIDTANAQAAARVVAEKIEDLWINGDSSINLNGNTIYGLTSHPNRNTDTATNYGGGDWGTQSNILPTIAGMIAAAQGDGFYGPYGVGVASTQYNQAALTVYTDGSGDTPRDRILRMPEVEFVEQIPQLDDGEVALFQLTPDVIEWRPVNGYSPITTLEWSSGDGMLGEFKVLAAGVPIVKSSYGGKSGIVIASGA